MYDELEMSVKRKVKVMTTNKKLKRFCLNFYLEISNKLLIIYEHAFKVPPEVFTLL